MKGLELVQYCFPSIAKRNITKYELSQQSLVYMLSTHFVQSASHFFFCVCVCVHIGRSWCMLFAAADYNVQVYDIELQQLTDALSVIETKLDNLSKQRLQGNLTTKQQLANISVMADISECVTREIYVQVFYKNFISSSSPWIKAVVIKKSRWTIWRYNRIHLSTQSIVQCIKTN